MLGESIGGVIIGYIARTYAQLDEPRREKLSADAARLLREQRDEETARASGVLTSEQLGSMTLVDLQRHAESIGVPPSAVVRVSEEAGR